MIVRSTNLSARSDFDASEFAGFVVHLNRVRDLEVLGMSLHPHAAHGAPAVIGPYRLVRELGRGGMGVVYEAVHETFAKPVAIKLIHPQLRSEAQFERFVREGRAACQIRHPNVVEVFEVGTHAGAPYMVMALLDGISLEELLHASKRLPLSAVLDLMLPIMSAVSAAHAAGVVHRDLKPSNILLARAEPRKLRPKLLDFGASKLEETNLASLTNSGTMLGTLPYMAAEQVYASRDADALSDQYSLAVVLYECVTGHRPFSAESGYQLMQAIMTEPISPPSAREPSLPNALDAVLLRALRRDRRERYPSVRAFARALLPFASVEARIEWGPELEASALGSGDVLEAGLVQGATLPDTERPGVAAPSRTDSEPLPALPRLRVRAPAWIALAVTMIVAIVFVIHRASAPTEIEPTPIGAAADVTPAPAARTAAGPSAPRSPPASAHSALAGPRSPASGEGKPPPPKLQPNVADATEHERRARNTTRHSSSGRAAASQPSAAERTAAVPETAATELGENGAPILE